MAVIVDNKVRENSIHFNYMDSRETVKKKEEFLQILQIAHQAGNNVNLLMDDEGISRAGGIITKLNTEAAEPFIELNNGLTVPLQSIVAVNGIFLPEYSEC